MICSACNAAIAEGVKFCSKCGARAVVLSAEISGIRCPQCGTENTANAKFCKKDGYRLDSVTEKTENTAKPVISAPVAEAPKEPVISKVVSQKNSPASDSVVCPQCGTENVANAKFCKKDGYALQTGVSSHPITQATPSKPAPTTDQTAAKMASMPNVATIGKSRKGLMIGALTGLALLTGGYAYWAGYIGKHQDAINNVTNAELNNQNPNNSKTTSLTESVQLSPSKLSQNIQEALTNEGMDWLAVKVDRKRVATISGGVADEEQKEKVISIAKSVAGVVEAKYRVTSADRNLDTASTNQANVNSPPPTVAPPPQVQAPEGTVDRATLASNLAGQLRAAGINGLTGRVEPDMTINLTGTVRSATERDEALRIATSIPGGNGVRENIRVVTPVNQQISASEKSMKSKKTEKQPDVALPESQPKQPDNTTAETKPEEPASTQQPEVPKSVKELLDNLKRLKIKPVTDEDRQNKTCPFPGQSC